MDSVLSQTYGDLLAKTFAESHDNAKDAAIDFNSVVDVNSIQTPFANQSLSNQLKMVAATIKAAPNIGPTGQKRQIFFVTIGGWDHHAGLIAGQNTLIPYVSQALSSFYESLVEIGCQNDVVTFTASDFARTLGTNGQGSDHAWGGNHIVMGGGVDGGKIFGEYPTSLVTPTADFSGLPGGTSSDNLNLGRGRMIPTLSVDHLAAELAMWFRGHKPARPGEGRAEHWQLLLLQSGQRTDWICVVAPSLIIDEAFGPEMNSRGFFFRARGCTC